MVSITSQDVTFCIKDECDIKKCPLHPKHINWSVGPPWRSYADFEGTKYCRCKPRKEK